MFTLYNTLIDVDQSPFLQKISRKMQPQRSETTIYKELFLIDPPLVAEIPNVTEDTMQQCCRVVDSLEVDEDVFDI